MLKNGELTEEETGSALFVIVASADGTLYFSGSMGFIPVKYSYEDPVTGLYQEEHVPENSVIFVRITEEQAAGYAQQWL